MRFVTFGMLICVLAGCAANIAPNQDADVASMAIPDGTSPEPTRVPTDNLGTIVSAGELVDGRSVSFTSWTELSDREIAINFVSGSPNCYGATAQVVETPTTITVSVVTGRLAAARDRACLMVASYSSLVVPLTEPVGSREVLSGS